MFETIINLKPKSEWQVENGRLNDGLDKLLTMLKDQKASLKKTRTENGTEYGDLPKFVDYSYVANVARLNAATMAALASAPAPPAKDGGGCASPPQPHAMKEPSKALAMT